MTNKWAYWEHAPMLFFGRDIEDVRFQAEAAAKQAWPVSEGWQKHTAVVTSAQPDAIRQLKAMMDTGMIDLDTSNVVERQMFNFDARDVFTSDPDENLN